jgi:uncharacterized repeat protein (TIGR01451 family)
VILPRFAPVSATTGADLSITVSASPHPALVGEPLTYNLSVANAGPTGVTVTDTLPSSVIFVSATPSQGTCSQSSGTVTCPFGTLAKGASATVTITVTPNSPGTISNTASVTSATTDPNPANNSATEMTTVDPAADLAVTNVAGVQKVKDLRRVTYTVTVSNAGPSAASGIQMTDSLPDQAMFVTATPSQGSCSTPPPGPTGIVTCSLSSLANSATATVQIVIDVKANGNGKTLSVTDTASVTSATTDPNPANNSQTITTVVKP